MTQQMLSRTQRRMEKKQTVLTLSMLLVIGLICFFLGVMVGKSGEQSLVSEEHLPSQQPPAAVQDKADVPEPVPAASQAAEGDTVEEPQLTFYDTLPQGQQNALGSGINLPPEAKQVQAVAEEVAKEPVKVVAPVKAIESQQVSSASAPKPALAPPVAAASGSYMVQVAAVKQQDGAAGLRDRMQKKGYAAFVEAADLGAKGVWYRVYAGPYTSKADADHAVLALKADRISSSPLVKRR